MAKQKLSARRVLSNNWFLLKIALQEAPFYTIRSLLAHAQHRIIVFIEYTYMIGYIINCIQYEKPFLDVLIFVGIVFAVVVFLVQIMNALMDSKIRPKATEKIQRRLRKELYRKAIELDLAGYDDPIFYNEFVWAMSEANTRLPMVINTYAAFIGEIAGILVIGGFVLTQDLFGIVLTAIAVGLTIFLSNLYNKLNLRFQEKCKPLERKRDYISRVFYLPDYAKELRMSKLKPKLYEEFRETAEALAKVAKRETKKLSVCSFALNYICNSFLFDGVYVIYLLFRTIVKNAFGYGTMVTLYNSCSSLENCSRGLAAAFPQFVEHGRYIEKIRHFLETEPEIVSKPDAKSPEPFRELCLRNISFSYPDGTSVLKNVDLTIRKGERIALVGYNGAGKTTLVKLLMRLYDATEGEITWNGRELRELKPDEYRRQFSTLFQDYQLFAATLGENITMDTEPIHREKAGPSLQKSGFQKKFDTLSNGYETPLTREFEADGVLLSGGESQMVGISRVLYRDSPIMILDEPSSALDPLSEYSLNHTMMTLDREKTVIFISHRLSTTRLADRIYMLEDGQIVEAGSHDSLMALDGKYAEMFKLQMEKYR